MNTLTDFQRGSEISLPVWLELDGGLTNSQSVNRASIFFEISDCTGEKGRDDHPQAVSGSTIFSIDHQLHWSKILDLDNGAMCSRPVNGWEMA